jgi:hypothetical protein
MFLGPLAPKPGRVALVPERPKFLDGHASPVETVLADSMSVERAHTVEVLAARATSATVAGQFRWAHDSHTPTSTGTRGVRVENLTSWIFPARTCRQNVEREIRTCRQ